MNARLGWKKLQGQATGLFRRRTRRVERPSAEAKIRSNLNAGVIIAQKRMARVTLHPIGNIRKRAAKTVKGRLLNILVRVGIKMNGGGPSAIDEVIQSRVAGFAVGVWGATTAAAITLALSAALGAQPREWILTILIVSGAMNLWNVATLVHFVRQFRQLKGDTRTRLLMLVASKVGVRGVIIIAAPVAALLALGAARLLLPIS